MIRNKSGITAMELAVTLAIMSVLATLTMPPYLNWLRGSRLQSAATNLSVDLEMAKVRAIRENATVVVEFGADNYTIFVDNGEGSGTAADWNRNGTESILQIRNLPAGVQIDTDSLSFPIVNDKTRFNGRGIPHDIVTPQTIRVDHATYNSQITINRLGNIDVQ